MVFGFGRKNEPAPRPEDPLPPVMPPEAPGNERDYLNRVLQESRAVLDADLNGFELVMSKDGWAVHRKPVKGNKLTMVRLEAVVPMRADALFSLLTSMDGKRIIDPFPKEHHAEHVKALRMPGGQASIVYSEAPRFAGMLRPREYVTCDAEVPKEGLFVCKSCQVRDGPLAAARKGRVRANLLFAMRIRDLQDQPGSHLQMVNWLDLGANTVPESLANLVTEHWYFQGVMRRLDSYTSKHGLTVDTPPAALESLLRSGRH